MTPKELWLTGELRVGSSQHNPLEEGGSSSKGGEKKTGCLGAEQKVPLQQKHTCGLLSFFRALGKKIRVGPVQYQVRNHFLRFSRFYSNIHSVHLENGNVGF